MTVMHTTRCIGIQYATSQDHGEEEKPLPYRLLIIPSLFLSPRHLSQRSRRNQVLRQHRVVWHKSIVIFNSILPQPETLGGCGTIKANKETHIAPQLG